jgi:hypothetical protein
VGWLQVPSFADFVDGQVQATIFTSSSSFTIGPALGLFMSNWPTQFQSVVFASEVANEFSPDAPRLILQSADARYKLHVGPFRLDIQRLSQSEHDKIDIRKDLSLCGDVIENYLKRLPSAVTRAMVLVRRMASHEAPAAEIARHFCKDAWLIGGSPIESLEAIEFNVAKNYSTKHGVELTGWFKCKSALFSRRDSGSNPPQTITGILVDQDLNIPPVGSTNPLKVDEIKAFFDLVPDEFDERLARFFPMGTS